MGLFFRLFRLFATGNFRGLFTVLLGLTLVWGLWETSLVRLSSREAATGIMTEVGVDFINPLLSNSLTQSTYTNLQKSAQAHPTQQLAVPGLTIKIQGSDIAGKSFDDGMRTIYGRVANAYYDGGAAGIFSGGSQVASLLGQFSQLTGAVTSQGAQAAGVPQLPQVLQFLSVPLGAVGLNPTLFTASGHAAALKSDEWVLGAAAIFALLLMVFSPRLHRISSVAWSLLTGALPGVVILGVVWFLWNRNTNVFAPYASLLNAVGGAVVPVYGGAFAVGAAGLVLAKVGDLVFKSAGMGKATPARAGARTPARAPSAGFGAYGQSSWNQQAETPRYRPYGSDSASTASHGQDAPWGVPPAAQAPRPSSSGYGAPSYGQTGRTWPATPGVQAGWDVSGQQGQTGWDQPAQGGWGAAPGQAGWGQGQVGQPGQGAWPQPSPSGWPQSAPNVPGAQGSQGGWGNPAQPGYGSPEYGQPAQGQAPGQQGSPSGPNQQRGAWPLTNEDDAWPPRR